MDIRTDIVWVRLRFSDCSELCIQTTLNANILTQKGIVLEDGHLPMLNKKYIIDKQEVYKQIPTTNVLTATIIEMPEYSDEFSSILSKFI